MFLLLASALAAVSVPWLGSGATSGSLSPSEQNFGRRCALGSWHHTLKDCVSQAIPRAALCFCQMLQTPQGHLQGAAQQARLLGAQHQEGAWPVGQSLLRRYPAPKRSSKSENPSKVKEHRDLNGLWHSMDV